MNITESELTALDAATTATDWNAVCDQIKRSRGGQYPPNWYAVVVLSGMAARKAEQFIGVKS